MAAAAAGRLITAWRLLGCLVGVVVLVGCAMAHKVVVKQPGPPVPSFHQGTDGIAFRRVAMLPLAYEQETMIAPRELDNIFHAELTKTGVLEIVQISRAQMQEMFGAMEVSSVEALPGDLLTQMMTRYNVDAILLTDVTHYFPYQPISMGVRSKLIDARTGEIRWAFDYLFDTGKPAVAQAAKNYFLQNNQTNVPIQVQGDGSSILQSPIRFTHYVAWETYRSLLNLNQPVPPGKNVLNSPKNPPM